MRHTRYASFFKAIPSPRLLAAPGRTGLWIAAAGLALAIFSVLGLVQGVLAQAAPAAAAAPALQNPADGQVIFNEKCAGCHTIGKGKLIGPDLKDITKQRDPQWIKTFIADPAKMIATDPDAKQLAQQYTMTMPTLGLQAAEIDALVAYLSNPGAAPAVQAPIPAAAGTGNPAAGKLLFTGQQPMTNGGTPCIACHSVTGAAPLDGGALGPDLTHVITRLGEPGVSAALKTIVFPTMLGPFQNHPLTPAEQADLVAFLRDADRQQAAVPLFAPGSWTANALLVLGIAAGGATLLFFLLLILRLRMNARERAPLPVRKVSKSIRRLS